MFQRVQTRSKWDSAFRSLEVVYHSCIKSLRSEHGNPVIGLVLSVVQVLVLVLIFYFVLSLMGRNFVSKIRGDIVLFLLSGVFLFLVHNKAVGSVLGTEGPTSSMMLHQPLNTGLLIAANALATLYNQTLVALFLLFVYHTAFNPVTIEQPVFAYGMLLLAWFTGVAVGVLLYAIKPWAPRLIGIVSTVYRRANMIASGKMVAANALPASTVAMFDWNPLFHAIDQARGFIFLNYNPHNSSLTYPVYFGITFLMLGLIGEYYTRRMASLHWSKGQ